MRKSDDLLREDVAAGLDWNPLLNDARVGVAADDGTVRLTGAVDTYYESLLAADGAWSIAGVRDVDNELFVGLVGDAIADLDLVAECERALEPDRHVPTGSVTATVVDGWVTLTGEVRRQYQRATARHAVSRVIGVLGVSDDTQITRAPIASEIGDRIAEALERNAIVGGSLIEVTNVGDTLYLDGTTASYIARDTAERVAWKAPGVRAVVNRLAIVPSDPLQLFDSSRSAHGRDLDRRTLMITKTNDDRAVRPEGAEMTRSSLTADRHQRGWGWSLVGGLFSIAFGFFVLSYEFVGLLALVYFACAYFLASGIYQLSASFRSPFQWWYPLMGVLSIFAGIVGLAWPGITLFVIAILIGWVLLGWGLADVINAFSSRHLRHWWVFLLRGLFAIVIGVIALRDPGSAVLGLVLVIGIWSVTFGIVEITTALEVRHTLRAIDGR